MKFKLGSSRPPPRSAIGRDLDARAGEGGDAQEMECDAVLVAIGRKPYTEGLGLEDVGVELTSVP